VRIAGFIPKPFAPDQLAQAVAVARKGRKWAGKDRRSEGDGGRAGPDRRSTLVGGE
jgi:DNA-binding NarL/FixJ family response regulator